MREFKLIFDECLSEPVLESLRPFLERVGIKLVLRSVVKYQRDGVPDKEWIPKIAAEGGWIIISSDRGKRNKREKFDEKLPYLCRSHRVTHVLLSGLIHNEKAFVKGQAVVAVWKELVASATATRGTRFKLKKRDRCDGFALQNDDVQQGKDVKKAARFAGETNAE